MGSGSGVQAEGGMRKRGARRGGKQAAEAGEHGRVLRSGGGRQGAWQGAVRGATAKGDGHRVGRFSLPDPRVTLGPVVLVEATLKVSDWESKRVRKRNLETMSLEPEKEARETDADGYRSKSHRGGG